MDKLKELINNTKGSISIEINKHRDCYESIDEHVSAGDREDVDGFVWDKMIELDTCVRIIVYPETPTGFYVIYHYDVEIAIDIAKNEY